MDKAEIERLVSKEIRRIKKALPSLATKEGSYNKCKFISYELCTRLRSMGVNARMVHIGGCSEDRPNAHSKWTNKDPAKWSHYCIRIGTTVIDMTAKQFGEEFAYPLVTTMTELRKSWELVHDDKFLNALADEIAKSGLRR